MSTTLSAPVTYQLGDYQVGWHPNIGDRFLTWLGWILMGYALMSRGFAYLGFPPLFIGEITLAFGVLALAYCRQGLPHVLRLAPAQLLVVVMVWGAFCTIPYISTWGINAFRDGALWGYGLFAFITAAVLIDKPERLRILLLRYRKFAVLYLSIIWIIWLVTRLHLIKIPFLFGSPFPIVYTLGGHIMAYMTGMVAFVVVGLVRPNFFLYVAIGLNFFLIGLINRGGMVSFVLTMLLVLILRPPHLKVGPFAYWFACLLLLLGLINPSFTISKGRTISVDQLMLNVESIFAGSDEGDPSIREDMDNTKNWRLRWWTQIVDYTVYGPYFWTGKGFGINLAEDDINAGRGSAAERGVPLRSPHNSHMSILARMGVPGFVLWLIMQFTWFGAMLSRYIKARRQGDKAWASIFVFLIACWAGFVINANFDVFLESPMGGIWFWVTFGVGLAALHIHRYHPDVAWS